MFTQQVQQQHNFNPWIVLSCGAHPFLEVWFSTLSSFWNDLLLQALYPKHRWEGGRHAPSEKVNELMFPTWNSSNRLLTCCYICLRLKMEENGGKCEGCKERWELKLSTEELKNDIIFWNRNLCCLHRKLYFAGTRMKAKFPELENK